MKNGVSPENKSPPYATSLSLFCAVGTSMIFFPLLSPLLRVPYYVAGLLYHSLFRKNKKNVPSLWKPSSCYLASAGDTFVQSLRLSCRMPYSSFLFVVFVL